MVFSVHMLRFYTESFPEKLADSVLYACVCVCVYVWEGVGLEKNHPFELLLQVEISTTLLCIIFTCILASRTSQLALSAGYLGIHLDKRNWLTKCCPLFELKT